MNQVQPVVSEQIAHGRKLLGPKRSNLLRPNIVKVMDTANRLREKMGILDTVKKTLEMSELNALSDKERDAYRSFLTFALAYGVEQPVGTVKPKVLHEKRGPYDAPKPDPITFQEEMKRRYP